METKFKTPQLSGTAKSGLICLAISFIVFISTRNVFDIDFEIFSGVFFINYGITFLYLIIVIRSNKEEFDRYFRFSNFTNNMLLLQLFNISAYTLNRSIPVFDISTDWLIWFLMISNVLLLVHLFWKDYTITWLSNLMVVCFNLALIFHLYESLYVIQLYPIAFLACWFFGISLHSFVPLLFVMAFIKIIRRFLKKSTQFWTTTLLTWVFAVCFIGYMSFQFHQINTLREQSFHFSQKPYDDKALPNWILLSQQLKKNWITERALKSGLAYSSVDRLFNSFGNFQLDERIKHDPLVLLAAFIGGEIDMSTSHRIKILRYLFDARHQTERKLWSGESLSTSDIVTNVQLFPEFRIAYTEKTFKIENKQINRWETREEALYTFYLPEGSVVTSASLWINDKEEPAYLTTKLKADSAYRAIVGVERRDPLLLHWQEGNRVTVRVFPCTPDEARQFKIGVSTPLKVKQSKLIYENIDFEGPYWKGAKESINIVSEGGLKNISAPYSFSKKGTAYTYIGNYQSDWTLEFDATPLSPLFFPFNGKKYQLQDYTEKVVSYKANKIYLDINKSWTKKEFNTLWKQVKDKSVYVYSNHRLEQVTEENKSSLFKELKAYNFSLFPIYKIDKPYESVLISKSNALTPTLSDLKGTVFEKRLSTFFQETPQALKVYNLGEALSPYLKTLQELRSIHAISGNLEKIVAHLQNNTFVENQETDHVIVNNYGKFRILESEAGPIPHTSAPDHLMRLFTYNEILKEVGRNYYNRKAIATDLIDEAKEAYVVTPISSLVVLETQKDYDRFNIQKSKNSLQNASFHNSGAVPEPKEWLLIIMVLGLVLYGYFRK